MDAWGTYEFDGTMYPGANDDAPGTATMMELARGVVEGIGAPAGTIVFAAWNAEEWGLLGSCAYVARPSYPMSSMTAMISMEQLGLATSILYAIVGGAAENRRLFDLVRTRRQEELLPGVLQATGMTADTNHWCFWNEGVPALSVAGMGVDRGYHSAEDGIEGVSRENLGGNAHLVWLALEPLARATDGEYED
jgi:Zn-dependent M28 family amino/carboxypeptidase